VTETLWLFLLRVRNVTEEDRRRAGRPRPTSPGRGPPNRQPRNQQGRLAPIRPGNAQRPMISASVLSESRSLVVIETRRKDARHPRREPSAGRMLVIREARKTGLAELRGVQVEAAGKTKVDTAAERREIPTLRPTAFRSRGVGRQLTHTPRALSQCKPSPVPHRPPWRNPIPGNAGLAARPC